MATRTQALLVACCHVFWTSDNSSFLCCLREEGRGRGLVCSPELPRERPLPLPRRESRSRYLARLSSNFAFSSPPSCRSVSERYACIVGSVAASSTAPRQTIVRRGADLCIYTQLCICARFLRCCFFLGPCQLQPEQRVRLDDQAEPVMAGSLSLCRSQITNSRTQRAYWHALPRLRETDRGSIGTSQHRPSHLHRWQRSYNQRLRGR